MRQWSHQTYTDFEHFSSHQYAISDAIEMSLIIVLLKYAKISYSDFFHDACVSLLFSLMFDYNFE